MRYLYAFLFLVIQPLCANSLELENHIRNHKNCTAKLDFSDKPQKNCIYEIDESLSIYLYRVGRNYEFQIIQAKKNQIFEAWFWRESGCIHITYGMGASDGQKIKPDAAAISPTSGEVLSQNDSYSLCK